MKISIIIPVFNTEKYLSKCLDHLVNQSYQNIEIICVNDGSTDNSLSILQRYAYKDPRVLIIDQPNSGPAQARNNGLTHATGEYIMFCDSDDWYELNMCELMIMTMHKYDTDLVICDSNIVEDLESYKFRRSDYDYCFLNQFGLYQLNYKNKLEVRKHLWDKIFRKHIIDRYKIVFPNGLEHDDACFIEQYLAASKYLFGLDQKLYNYVIREGSLMHNTYFVQNNYIERITTYKLSLDCLMKNQLLSEDNFYFLLTDIYNNIKWIYSTYNNQKDKNRILEESTKILCDIDLDSHHENLEIKALKNIKSKSYEQLDFYNSVSDIYCTNGEEIHTMKQEFNNPKRNATQLKTLINFLKSYLLWPYYIYRIYKKTK